MKKLLLSIVVVLGLQAHAQQTLFEDSFETYTDFAISDVGFWTLTDVDLKVTYGFTGVTFLNSGVAKSFQVFNSTATAPPLTPSATSNWAARTGTKAMVCFAAASATPLNNDWMISPEIQLSVSGNTLTFWAKSCDAAYGLERFKVGVSTTDTAPASFTIISAAPYIVTLPNVTYAQYTYNLDAYAGQPVYIGINCVSNDQFGFAVDDFKVTADDLSTDSFFSSNFKVYPNPASSVLNVDAKTSAINEMQLTDLNGRIVKSIKANGVNNAQINISDLNAGVYFLKVTSNEGTGTTKVVKN
ncbi:MAG TPA: T9SS type A sorting domain-containing protein [Flavobacterium sp.]|nr:T9SS type A sorting domain-containing protein [Flavobacterium sp.]